MKRLFKQYENTVNSLRQECEKKLKQVLSKATSHVTFKESVYLHFISDNIYTDLKRVDKDLTMYADVHVDAGGTADVFQYGLEELDAAGLYELLLALKEKRIEVV